MTSATVGEPLTSAQVREFEERGYLILPAVFEAGEIAEMAREADRILALCLNASLAVGERDPRLDVMACEDDPSLLNIRKIQPVKDLSDTFLRLSTDERFLRPMRQLMGHEPVLMEEKLNYKQKVRCPAYLEQFAPPAREAVFYLHHDWGYYRQQGYPPETLSSAISLDATIPENGPIRVIPGTHLKDWPLKDPDPAHGQGLIEDGIFEEADRVEILAPAGSVMLFHSRLLHDSTPNRTDAPRRLMIYSHYPGNHAFEEDQRNRRGRLAGQEIENSYREKVARGEFQDVFPDLQDR